MRVEGAGIVVGLAGVFVAVAVSLPAESVAGEPVGTEADRRELVERVLVRPEFAVPSTASTTVAPPAQSTSAAPPPPPASTQAPGTVRLARGGTATLVRKEVVNGVLPVPEGIREATWWGANLDAGAGATVLAGHVNWKGATGPFAELWNARLGDPVTVVDGNGRSFQYAVRQLVTVHKNELPQRAAELFGQDGDHRLVLVTCGGRWVGGSDGYEENRIVIATPA